MDFKELLNKVEEVRLTIPMNHQEVSKEMGVETTSWFRIRRSMSASPRVIRAMKEFLLKYEGK